MICFIAQITDFIQNFLILFMAGWETILWIKIHLK
jgi:hypothetical protein